MIKDIWHNPPQTPDVFKSHPIIVIYEAGDQIEQMDSKEYSDLVGERYVNRWCYVDDLIKENDRTRKALDVALCSLQDIAESDGDFITGASTPLDEHEYADMMLKEIKRQMKIKTALEQKDVK